MSRREVGAGGIFQAESLEWASTQWLGSLQLAQEVADSAWSENWYEMWAVGEVSLDRRVAVMLCRTQEPD